MRAPLSIIIPTLNSADTLGACSAALFEGLDSGLIRELIASDGGSDDGTEELANDLGSIFISGKPGRGGQLRRGAEAAAGEWFLFLHADTLLSAGWSGAAQYHMTEHPDRAACFRLGFRVPSLPARTVAAWANLRTKLFDLPYGDQGLLISADEYTKIGGFPDTPLMEDVAIARARTSRTRILTSRAVTSAEKYETNGWLRQSFRNFWTLSQYLAGASPERLAHHYRRKNR